MPIKRDKLNQIKRNAYQDRLQEGGGYAPQQSQSNNRANWAHAEDIPQIKLLMEIRDLLRDIKRKI